MNRAPKFGKVEILLVSESKDQRIAATNKVEFSDCGLMITGNYLIVVIDERDEINNTVTSTGKIYPMDKVTAYKTHSI